MIAEPDYHAEIDKYIVYPCWAEMAKKHGADQIFGLDNAVEVMLAIEPEGRQTIIDAALPTAKTLNRKNRLLFYEMGKAACIGGLEE